MDKTSVKQAIVQTVLGLLGFGLGIALLIIAAPASCPECPVGALDKTALILGSLLFGLGFSSAYFGSLALGLYLDLKWRGRRPCTL